jgi:hypothetical protein
MCNSAWRPPADIANKWWSCYILQEPADRRVDTLSITNTQSQYHTSSSIITLFSESKTATKTKLEMHAQYNDPWVPKTNCSDFQQISDQNWNSIIQLRPEISTNIKRDLVCELVTIRDCYWLPTYLVAPRHQAQRDGMKSISHDLKSRETRYIDLAFSYQTLPPQSEMDMSRFRRKP